MASSMKNGLSVSMSHEGLLHNNNKCKLRRGYFSHHGATSSSSSSSSSSIGALHFPNQNDLRHWNVKAPSRFFSVNASVCVSKAMRWWEKTLKPNMVEIHSAEELVDSLLNAGDRLVILDFYSPGCGGCKALHPKICKLAESNPDAIFLKVNYEEMKPMCHSLHIHVLPFFRFYRGAEGKLCSFSCTNATIKKFKDALAKHGGGGERWCSSGGGVAAAAKGLCESDLVELALSGQISTHYASERSRISNDKVGDFVLEKMGSVVMA